MKLHRVGKKERECWCSRIASPYPRASVERRALPCPSGDSDLTTTPVVCESPPQAQRGRLPLSERRRCSCRTRGDYSLASEMCMVTDTSRLRSAIPRDDLDGEDAKSSVVGRVDVLKRAAPSHCIHGAVLHDGEWVARVHGARQARERAAD